LKPVATPQLSNQREETAEISHAEPGPTSTILALRSPTPRQAVSCYPAVCVPQSTNLCSEYRLKSLKVNGLQPGARTFEDDGCGVQPLAGMKPVLVLPLTSGSVSLTKDVTYSRAAALPNMNRPVGNEFLIPGELGPCFLSKAEVGNFCARIYTFFQIQNSRWSMGPKCGNINNIATPLSSAKRHRSCNGSAVAPGLGDGCASGGLEYKGGHQRDFVSRAAAANDRSLQQFPQNGYRPP